MDNLSLIHNAEEKLKKGAKSINNSDVATLIQDNIISKLSEFCKEEPQIAKAIINSDKSIYDCCKEITKDTKTKRYISDFEAYSRAVKFFLPDAEIDCNITVKRKGHEENIIKLSLFDLLE